jgi:Xaa-Pro aminopeptidase
VPNEAEGKRFNLFVRNRNPEREQWDGLRLGVEGAQALLPVDAVFPIDSLWEKFPALARGHTKIHYSLGRDEEADRKFIAGLTAIRATRPRFFDYKMPIVDSDYLAGEMRHCKAPDEIARMQRAADITDQAFRSIYKHVRPGMNEREVHGMLISEFYRNGAEMEAYGTIVAGGANACILHYVENNQVLKDGELLLVDAGAQFDYYAADVTRTFPVGTRFTSGQRALYEIVLESNKKAIAAVKVGTTLGEIHKVAVETLVEGLLETGILKGTIAENMESHAYKKYYMHSTSHWLGMDVHDVGPYQRETGGEWKPTALAPGMVLTVEPGLYIPPGDASVRDEFRGIGIRIEDDILVTEAGYRNLTQGIPKEVPALESR